MASAGGNPGAASSSSSSNPECRMRRRRRLAPPPRMAEAASEEKRVRPASPSTSSEERDQQRKEGQVDAVEEAGEPQPLPAAGLQVPAAASAPAAFGWLSVAGRSREMEDAVSLRPGFHTWIIDGSPMHFFAVFDGHGGSHVSTLCRDRMHEFLAEELAAEGAALLKQQQQQAAAEGDEAAGTTAAAAAAEVGEEEEERSWRSALARTFRRIDAMASLACACGRIVRPRCRCSLSGNSGIVGSTAVVAVLVRGRIVVANCGDSRAVLCRGAAGDPPVPLSVDHKVYDLNTSPSLSPEHTYVARRGDSESRRTRVGIGGGTCTCGAPAVWWDPPEERGWWAEAPPASASSGTEWNCFAAAALLPDRPDELARIEAAGGRVLYINGHRVRGILAMSRALGDRMLRPEVIAEPEITITERTPEDQCLILASDGMWDVIPNEIACSVARQCLEDGNPEEAVAAAAGAEPEARCSRAASLLVRLALGRTTWDNVSVVVIDLKQRE